jgi:hypothetical protein
MRRTYACCFSVFLVVYRALTPRLAGRVTATKPKKEIMSEIQAIIRQITASVSFLPLLEEQCAFDLLVYTDKNSEVPALWEESDPRYIKDSAEVRLRSFSTKVRGRTKPRTQLTACPDGDNYSYADSQGRHHGGVQEPGSRERLVAEAPRTRLATAVRTLALLALLTAACISSRNATRSSRRPW